MALTKPYPVNPDIHLPTTLDWYRQTANWLVSLATGALTVGLATADKIPINTIYQKTVTYSTITAFLLSVGSGIWFYFWITSFANHLERRDKYANFYKKADTVTEKADYLAKHEKAHSDMMVAEKKYDWPYKIMLGAFVAAVAGTMLILVNLLLTEQPAKPPKRTIFTRNSPSDNQTYMMDENTGDTWVLTPDTTHTLVWKPILIPTLPVASTVVAGTKKK